MNPETQYSVRKMLGNAWLAGILAVLELILGFAMLSFPLFLGTAAVWVSGFVLCVVGLINLWHVFSQPGHRWWSLLSGIMYLVVGAALVLAPLPSLELITLILGIALLLGGLVRLVVAIAMHREAGAAWRYFNAVISLVLGTMVVWSWPASSVWLIGTVIAVEMIFSGWTLLFLSLSPRQS